MGLTWPKRLAVGLHALLVAAMCTGCGLPRIDRPLLAGAAWIRPDALYYLRTVGSNTPEVWRHGGGADRRIARVQDVPDACGPVHSLFKAGGETLGIALQCRDVERLVGYSSEGVFHHIVDVPPAAEVVMLAGGQGGYTSGGINGCWYLSRFPPSGAPVTAVSPRRLTCEGGGSSKSPLVGPAGELVFAGTRAVPPKPLNGREERWWHVYVSEPGSPQPRAVGPALRGFPEMDQVAGEPSVVVALTEDRRDSRIVQLDLGSGAIRELVRSGDSLNNPTTSPDGRKIAYIENLERLVIRDLPRTGAAP